MGYVYSSSQKKKKKPLYGKPNDGQVLSAELPTNGSTGNRGRAFQEYPYGAMFHKEDILLAGISLLKAIFCREMGFLGHLILMGS